MEHFETARVRKDGRRIRVSLTLSPIRDSAERLIGFSTIARDITAQGQMREALVRRERKLDDLECTLRVPNPHGGCDAARQVA